MILSNWSQGYVPSETGERILEPYFHMENAYAAGAMYSTAEDLCRWDQALYEEKLISKKTKTLYFAPHIHSGGTSYYGYGWTVGKVPLGAHQRPTACMRSGITRGLTGITQ